MHKYCHIANNICTVVRTYCQKGQQSLPRIHFWIAFGFISYVLPTIGCGHGRNDGEQLSRLEMISRRGDDNGICVTARRVAAHDRSLAAIHQVNEISL